MRSEVIKQHTPEIKNFSFGSDSSLLSLLGALTALAKIYLASCSYNKFLLFGLLSSQSGGGSGAKQAVNHPIQHLKTLREDASWTSNLSGVLCKMILKVMRRCRCAREIRVMVSLSKPQFSGIGATLFHQATPPKSKPLAASQATIMAVSA
ncbi:hypothetical protein VTI28DRAFT_6901 [Corynascus sepedonium]